MAVEYDFNPPRQLTLASNQAVAGPSFSLVRNHGTIRHGKEATAQGMRGGAQRGKSNTDWVCVTRGGKEGRVG